MRPTPWRRLLACLFVLALFAATLPGSVAAHNPASVGITAAGDADATDPARNVPLLCENGLLPIDPAPGGRSHKRIVHITNRCGVVGTDIEFQSRVDSTGKLHDYAFLGTMGFGLRIFDITDPANPTPAGAYGDQGWENDVQVRGDIAVLTFDGVAGEDSTTSDCMNTHHPEALGQGVDIIKLNYNKTTAKFTTTILTCVPNPPGGAHNSTIDPTGRYLAISNPSSDWAVDIIDLTRAASVGDANGQTLHTYRLIDESRAKTSSNDGQARCPSDATFTCIVMTRSYGNWVKNIPISASRSASRLWRPHDVHFSRDGRTMYVAALNSTFIVDVSRLLDPTATLSYKVKTISIIPNVRFPRPECSPDGSDPLCDPRNIELSHQADIASDGKILVISDERGGGLTNTGCNTDAESGVLGALHFYALAPLTGVAESTGASPSTPKYLGDYFSPNPGLAVDPLDPFILPTVRLERGCTAHVFRLGGNGTSSPGPGTNGFNGVSGIPKYRLTEAWYGAGTWQIDFSRSTATKPSNGGVLEDPRTTWGYTLGWNVQPGADTWSAKEYKGFIYTGDMLRGMDVFTNVAGRDPFVLLSKAGPATAVPGEEFTYTISYQNLGPAASSNARITDRIPAGVYFKSAPGGTYDPATRTVTWELGTLPVDASGAVTLRVRVHPTTAPGTVVANRADFTGDLTLSLPAYATTVVSAPVGGSQSRLSWTGSLLLAA